MSASRPQPASSSLVTDVRRVASILGESWGLLEAPRCDGSRWLFSDITHGGVWATGAESVGLVVARRRGVGGVVLHEDGIVVGGRDLLHVRGDGHQQVVLADPQATGVNDLHVLPDGSIVAGLLRFRPMAGEAPAPGRVVRVSVSGEVCVLDESILWPNGIGHAPSGDRIYVSDYAAQRVVTLPVDGGPAEVFCTIDDGAPDGLAVDVEGGVWVALATGGALARFDPDGTRTATVPLPAGFISSLAFGGADRRDLRITGMGDDGGVLFGARSLVPGLPTHRAVVPVSG